MILALMAATGMCFVGCKPEPSIIVSTQDLWFGIDAGTKTVEINANCDWTITQNDNADWYTITPMSGSKNDRVITVTVNDYPDGDFRGSSFIIASSGSHIRHTVFVSQNKLNFDGMMNKVFGVVRLEKWNTDYFDQIIEDSYRDRTYDPYDIEHGYQMYFLENGQGVQCDHHSDTAVYYSFKYNYNPLTQILHIEFETVSDTVESYNASVLTASDSLYRFIHEYRAHFWERADMRKIRTIQPDEASFLRREATRRKGDGGIFRVE